MGFSCDEIEQGLKALGLWYVRGKHQFGVHCPSCGQGATIEGNLFRCLSRGCHHVATTEDFLAGKPTIKAVSTNWNQAYPRDIQRVGNVAKTRNGKGYTARIDYQGEKYYLGRFDTEEQARGAIAKFLDQQR